MNVFDIGSSDIFLKTKINVPEKTSLKTLKPKKTWPIKTLNFLLRKIVKT
jgi:hypothetical protein